MKRNGKGQFIKGSNGNTFEGFGIWYTKKGYPTIWINGKNIMIHCFVWERSNGKRPKGFDIHHIDFDKKNYKLSNLELVSKSDHLKIHARWLRNGNGEFYLKPCKVCKCHLPLDSFYERKTVGTPSNICKLCASHINKIRLKIDPSFREKKRLYLKEYYRKNKKQILQNQKDARKTKLSGV